MFRWLSSRQMTPSRGLFMPLKRSSNLAVFALSSSFRQTVRPRLLSRARQTFDMLPCPVVLSRSKRLRRLIVGRLPFGLPPPNSFLIAEKSPTVRPSFMFAIVDDPGQLGAQVLARDDAVDESVLEQELARL